MGSEGVLVCGFENYFEVLNTFGQELANIFLTGFSLTIAQKGIHELSMEKIF